MKHLGDITKINGAEIEPVDCITFGSPCFVAGTLILTTEGYKEIENVRVGDIVLTHRGNWKPVEKVGFKTAETIVLKGNNAGIECTKNHPFYSGIEEWTDAEKMNGKRYAVPCCINGLDIPKMVVRSLFDGIGGFPLVWEETYGKGTARWASEIESFPISVTKYRFPEENE